MGVKLKRVSSVAAALVATVLTGSLGLSTLGVGASEAAPRKHSAPVADFTVSSFNVLGSSHTPAGGKRAVGTTRVKWAEKLLTRHSVDVVGFQEMQSDQLTTFLGIDPGAWDVYPGFELRQRDTENSIAWRTNQFELVHATTVNIPYFTGNPRPMPVVLLRHKASGMLSYFANFHNPADTKKYRKQAKWRAEATRVEIALANQLYEARIPRFITGDMNERAPYYCAMTGGAPMRAARGGSWTKGVCDAEKPRAVDWLFGPKKATYTDYVEDRSALVAKTTDHPMISSQVHLDSSRFPKSVQAPPAPFVARVTY